MVDELEAAADSALKAGRPQIALGYLTELASLPNPGFERLLKLAAVQRACHQLEAAIMTVDRALVHEPLNPHALLLRATLLHDSGRHHQAGEAYGRALSQMPITVPPQFAAVMTVARSRYAAWQDQYSMTLRRALAQKGATSSRAEAFIKSVVRLAPPERDGPTHYCYPGLGQTGFFDRQLFPWLDEIEASTDFVQREFDRLLRHRLIEASPYINYPTSAPLNQWEELNQNSDWSVFHLIKRGVTNSDVATCCPHTMKLLSRLPQPDIDRAGPNAMFSMLAPHTHIPPHTGVTNTRLVCHLPLRVPDGCWFSVGGERREVERGKSWVFDDTIEHEAMNESDEMRAILLFDIWHPALDAADRDTIRIVIGMGDAIHAL